MIFNKLEEVKEENENQVQLYMHYFKIKKGILLYVDKDRLQLKEFVVDYNKERAEKLIKDLVELKTKIDSDTIPARITEYPDDWQCKYCAFREICSIASGNELKWEEFKKKIGES